MSGNPKTSSTTAFAGFDIPRQNWFKMPNNWTDITAEISSIAELKVVEYVLKHTWGYQEYGVRKRITNDEFMHGRKRKDGTRIDKGTGLSKPSVIAGLKSAVERGLLIEEIDDTDRARVKKYYSLRMMPELADEFPEENDDPPDPPNSESEKQGVKDLNAGVKDLYPEVKNLYPWGKRSLPRTEKDTLERNLKEESNNNNSGVNAETQNDVVVALINFGLAEKVAQRLATRYSQERIAEKINFLTYLQETDPQKVKNPQGWLRSAIEDDFAAPEGYITPEEQQRRDAAEDHHYQEQEAARQAEAARAASEKATQQAARAAFEEQLATQWGTEQQELDLWQEITQSLKQRNFHPMLLSDLRLLKLDQQTAKIGVSNELMANRVQHPGTIKQLEREFSYFTKGPIQLEFYVIGTPPSDLPGKTSST